MKHTAIYKAVCLILLKSIYTSGFVHPGAESARFVKTRLFQSAEPDIGDWGVYQDKSRGGRTYYFNKKTGESTWTRPSSATIKISSSVDTKEKNKRKRRSKRKQNVDNSNKSQEELEKETKAMKEKEKFSFGQRIESAKTGVVGLVSGGFAAAPIIALHDLVFADYTIINGVAQWEFDTDMGSIEAALFALVYRYCVREDENEMLGQGCIGAFVIVRTLSRIRLPSYCTSAPLDCK